MSHIVPALSEPENASAARDSDLWRRLVSATKDYAIFFIDAQGFVRTWNHGAELTKGYGRDEIIGRHVSTFYTAEDRERGLPGRLLELAAQDGRAEDEGWRVRKDGTRFWADVVVTALQAEDGRLEGFVEVTRDRTERRRVSEALRASEERFRVLVEGVKDYAIFMLDRHGYVATWNIGAERIKGYTAKEIIGQHFSRFYDPAEVATGLCDRELEIAAREGRFEDEGWRVRKDGTRFWANVVITGLRDASGQLAGYAKVTRDLTERRRVEEQRIRIAQMQEAVRVRDEFLTIVSHELKTPLTALQLQLQSLLQRTDAMDQKVTSKLERANRSGDRLADLIESLLDMSRIATGRLVLDRETCDLAELVRQVAEDLRMAAAKAGSELELQLAGPISGVWDRVRLEQVVINLLANAIKYGAGAPITICLRLEEGEALLVVRDRGPGVPDSDRERIFGRFERAASTRNYGGLGIGLYVTREILTAHAGSIRVENAPGGGAEFIVRLPAQPAADALTGARPRHLH
jgi:PAS domain S-box-containing protein